MLRGSRRRRAARSGIGGVGILAVLTLLVGCTSSSTDAGSPSSGSTSPAGTSTPLPASAGAQLTQAQTESALPATDVLGAGWTAQRSTLDPSAVTTGPSTRVRSDCTASGALALAALPDHAPVTEAELHLSTGTGSTAQAAGVQILSYSDELGVRDLTRVEEAIDECQGFTVTLSDGSTVPATLAPLALSTDLGDGVFAVRVSYTSGGTLLFQDIAHVVVGHTLMNLLQVGSGTTGADVLPTLARATVAQLASVTARS